MQRYLCESPDETGLANSCITNQHHFEQIFVVFHISLLELKTFSRDVTWATFEIGSRKMYLSYIIYVNRRNIFYNSYYFWSGCTHMLYVDYSLDKNGPLVYMLYCRNVKSTLKTRQNNLYMFAVWWIKYSVFCAHYWPGKWSQLSRPMEQSKTSVHFWQRGTRLWTDEQRALESPTCPRLLVSILHLISVS